MYGYHQWTNSAASRFEGAARVAVLEKGWIGSGNAGRNTTIIRSNYLLSGNLPFYEFSMKLWEGLEQELNYNAMVSQRGVLNLFHSDIQRHAVSMPDVRILRRTTVFGAYDSGMFTGSLPEGNSSVRGKSGGRTFGALERISDHLPIPPAHQPRQRLWKIIAKRTVLAAGAIERPIVFGGNDRPGVMMASAVRAYVNRFGVTPGHRVALFTTTDDGWKTAFDLAKSRIAVEAVIDARGEVAPILLLQAKRIGARVLCGARVVDVHGARGVTGITVRNRDNHLETLPIDTLAVSGGWNPNLSVSTHVGGRSKWSDVISSFVPDDLPRGMTVVGAAAGSFSLRDTLRQGAAAGAAAAQAAGFSAGAFQKWGADDEATGLTALWHVSESRSKAFVDFQHDVTPEDVALAAREGFRSVELLKRYTTLGMATDQGKTSSVNGHAIMAALTERAIPEVGMTTFRPPYTPVALGAFAGPHRGKHFKPTRLRLGP